MTVGVATRQYTSKTLALGFLYILTSDSRYAWNWENEYKIVMEGVLHLNYVGEEVKAKRHLNSYVNWAKATGLTSEQAKSEPLIQVSQVSFHGC